MRPGLAPLPQLLGTASISGTGMIGRKPDTRSNLAMKTSTDVADAKSRILQAAVRLFAERGIEGVSLRELTAEAEVNIAAVNYHFGSRSGLEEAVFEDVAMRVNKQRLTALKAVLKASSDAGTPPALEAIVDAFIEPYLGESAGNLGALLARLILKHRQAPTELTRRLVKDHFDPMARKFIDAMVLANPGIERSEFVWRYMFMTSAVVLTATDRKENNRVAAISSGRQNAADNHALRASLMSFLVGGLTAPGAIRERQANRSAN